MDIRQLTVDDAVAYRELRLRSLREDPEGFGSTYAEVVDRPLSFTIDRLLAQDAGDGRFTLGAFTAAGALVGSVVVLRGDMAKRRHVATVVAMYVVPELRGQGVGRALLAEAIDRARRVAGLERLQLAAVTTNAAALGLYRSMGFETYGVEPDAMKLGDQTWDEALLALRLSDYAKFA